MTEEKKGKKNNTIFQSKKESESNDIVGGYSAERHFYMHDRLGSVRAVFDNNAVVDAPTIVPVIVASVIHFVKLMKIIVSSAILLPIDKSEIPPPPPQ